MTSINQFVGRRPWFGRKYITSREHLMSVCDLKSALIEILSTVDELARKVWQKNGGKDDFGHYMAVRHDVLWPHVADLMIQYCGRSDDNQHVRHANALSAALALLLLCADGQEVTVDSNGVVAGPTAEQMKLQWLLKGQLGQLGDDVTLKSVVESGGSRFGAFLVQPDFYGRWLHPQVLICAWDLALQNGDTNPEVLEAFLSAWLLNWRIADPSLDPGCVISAAEALAVDLSDADLATIKKEDSHE